MLCGSVYDFRYLLLEFNFTSEEEKRQAFTSLTERLLSKQIREEVMQAILSLYGNYELGCVIHSLNGITLKQLSITIFNYFF